MTTENKRGLQSNQWKIFFFTILLNRGWRYSKYFESENEHILFGPKALTDEELKSQGYVVTCIDENKIFEYACEVIFKSDWGI